MTTCGSCKSQNVSVDHVRECYGFRHTTPSATAASVTWQDNKSATTAHVLYGVKPQPPVATLTRPIERGGFGVPDTKPVADTVIPGVVRSVVAGRYAIAHGNGVVKFFKVDKPTEGRWAGYTFVKRVAGGEEFPVQARHEREVILTRIGLDPAAASKLYGTEIGECGVCGRQLTHEHSRAAGIGPVCAAKFGW